MQRILIKLTKKKKKGVYLLINLLFKKKIIIKEKGQIGLNKKCKVNKTFHIFFPFLID